MYTVYSGIARGAQGARAPPSGSIYIGVARGVAILGLRLGYRALTKVSTSYMNRLDLLSLRV